MLRDQLQKHVHEFAIVKINPGKTTQILAKSGPINNGKQVLP
jgi:hypothetical protein